MKYFQESYKNLDEMLHECSGWKKAAKTEQNYNLETFNNADIRFILKSLQKNDIEIYFGNIINKKKSNAFLEANKISMHVTRIFQNWMQKQIKEQVPRITINLQTAIIHHT